LSALTQLNLSRCSQLTSLRGLERCGASSLRKLTVFSSPVSSVQPLALCEFTDLSELYLSYCTRLTSLQGLGDLPSLAVLGLRGCSQLRLSRSAFGACVEVHAEPGAWLD